MQSSQSKGRPKSRTPLESNRTLNYTMIASVAVVLSSVIVALAYTQDSWSSFARRGLDMASLPQKYVSVDPRTYAVLGSNSTRQSSFTQYFNPTNNSPPFFQIFDPSFLDILGPNATFDLIASNDTFAFAHEAPIYSSATDEIFFVSNDGGPLGMSDINNNNQISKISLAQVEQALASSSGGSVNVNITKIPVANTIQMTNGGTGPYKGSLLIVNSGRGPLSPSMALVNPLPPYNSTVLVDNFFGRQFNSLNDIKIHPSGNLFFTDVPYGWLNHFRSEPLMPNQVYRFNTQTASLRVVADGFTRPNGIAFTGDGKIAYITDTGASGGFLGNNQTNPATIYAFDVDKTSQAFMNRRVFAYIDTGVPDGIQVDMAGNVYSGCGDGVQVWNSEGTLLGKFFIATTSANMAFAGYGRLVILAETKVYLAKTAAKGPNLEFP